MSDGVRASSDLGAAPRLRLVERWADFTKVRSIYPATNERVQQRLQEMRAALADCVTEASARPDYDPERGITVLFHSASVVFDGNEERPVSPGSVLSWLRQRISHAGLAGVELLADVGPDALLAFTDRLLANFLRKEADITFTDLWPETYEGLVLVDRRFEGTFGGLAVEGPFAGGHAGTNIQGSESRHFVMGLLAHPKVASRVAALQREGEGDETLRATDLLRRIMDDLPAEALKSRDTLITEVCRVVDGLRPPPDAPEALLGANAPPVEDVVQDGSAFATLLYQVSRTHFARKGPELERLKPSQTETLDASPAGGRPRDAAIDDDVETLVREVQTLPVRLDYDLGRGDADSRPEQLAVFLHYLVHLDRPADLAGLYPTLDRLLEGAEPQHLAVLRENLLGDSLDATEAVHRRKAIMRFLIRAGRTPVLRHCDILTPEFVLQDPGRHLAVYLASLDTLSPQDLTELDDLCEILQPVLAAPDARLQRGLAELKREQAAGLFREPSHERLLLIRQLLAVHPGRLVPEAGTYLRALDFPEEESFLLYQFRDPAHVRRTYLCALIDLHLGRIDARLPQRAAMDILCTYIRSTRDPVPTHSERMASIRALARFPSANGWQVLKDLLKTRWGPFGPHEPSPVRKLARQVLKDIQAPGNLQLEAELQLDDLDRAVLDGPQDCAPVGASASRTQAA